MSLSFAKKPVIDSKGTKTSFLIWVISILLFVLQVKFIPTGTVPPNLERFLLAGDIGIGFLAFISTIYFVVRQSLIVTEDKAKRPSGVNPWTVSTVLLLIVLAFLMGRSITYKGQSITPTRQIIKTEPAKAKYQQIIVQPTSTTTTPPVQNRVPVSFSDGSTRNCDQNAAQALRDANSAFQSAEQQKSQCRSQYAQKDINRASSCEKNCYSQYDYQTQSSQRTQCINQCYSDYKNFANSSGNICNTYSSSQKANLDYLINKYCR